MTAQAFDSVWDAIEDTPGDAERMRIRAGLMLAIERTIRAQGWTQTEAARRLGVTQPRISDLLRGKINLFSIDSLVDMVSAAGQHVEITVSEPMDRSDRATA